MIDVLILNFKIFVKNVHFLSKYKSSIDLTSKRPNTQNQIIKRMTQCRNSRNSIKNYKIFYFEPKWNHFHSKELILNSEHVVDIQGLNQESRSEFQISISYLSFKNCHLLDAGMSKISLSRLSEVLSYPGYLSKFQISPVEWKLTGNRPEYDEKCLASTGSWYIGSKNDNLLVPMTRLTFNFCFGPVWIRWIPA